MSAQPAPPTAHMFVLRHAAHIDQAVQNIVRRKPFLRGSADDLRQDLILHLLQRAETFDPTRSSASTWIHWQLRQVATRHQRGFHRWERTRKIPQENLQTSRPPLGERDLVIRLDLARVVGSATAPERAAIVSVLEGDGRRETKARIGISYEARNKRLRRLGQRQEAAA